MKRKIIALLCAFNIFSFTTLCCYAQPVFALPVISSEVLFNGLMSLLFTLGVSLDLTNLTKETANDVIQNKIEDGINASPDSTVLQEQYQEFLNGIEKGYCKVGIDLYNFLKELFYNDIVRPDFINQSIPAKVWDAVEYYNPTGYMMYQKNYYYYNSSDKFLMTILNPLNNNATISLTLPPEFSEKGSFTNYYKWATINNSNYFRCTHIYFTDNYSYSASGSNSKVFELCCANNTSPDYIYLGYVNGEISSAPFSSLVPSETSRSYDLILDGVWVDTDGDITTVDGTYPQVLDGDKVADIAGDITAGTTTWTDAISQEISDYPDNPAVPDKGLTISQLDNLVAVLDLDRLATKFPFCIPNDLMLIMNGATSVSGNSAPVIEIPMRLEFNGTVYYENDKAIVIDFNDFSEVVTIFREGFFLLFLIALLWVSIDILQAFFVVTE